MSGERREVRPPAQARGRRGGSGGAGPGSQAPGTGGRVVSRPLARPRRPVVGARPSAPSAPSVVRCNVRAVYRAPLAWPPRPPTTGPAETLAPWGPRRVRGRRGSSPRHRPPRPDPGPEPSCVTRARQGSLRSEGGPSQTPVPSRRDGRLQPRPELGRSRFQFLTRPRRLQRECGRQGSPGPPALPGSPPPRAHLTSRTGCRGTAGAAPRVLLNSTGAGTAGTAGTRRGPRAEEAAQRRSELAAEAGRGRGGEGAAGWVGQEKRRETALCRFPLPAGPPQLPREERLLFLLRLSLYSPSGAASSPACLEAREGTGSE